MRVYKGTTATDVWLPDFPTALIAFYTDRVEPRIPEAELWKAFFQDGPSKGDESILTKALSAIQYNLLSTVGQEIISEPLNLDKVLKSHGIVEFTKENFYIESPIAAMTTLKKSTNDRYDVCCPVLTTESGNIFILDPANFSILYQANANRIKSTPFLVAASGIFNVQYRIIIACRERHVCLLRKDWLEGKTIIQTMNTISDFIIIPDDGFIVIATVDKLLHCYTKKGHKLWSINMAHLVTCLCLIPIRHLSITLTAVGLKNGTIQIYHGRKCVDQTSVPGSPSVIKFGQLGQEENALITVTNEGTVIFRILKRTAEFQLNTTENLPLYQTKPLPLPKRSALFLEQSMREQQTALDIHQCFQQDLIKFRLNAARELMKSELSGSSTRNRA
nr:unnamed protein product [Callosobruchus analis]